MSLPEWAQVSAERHAHIERVVALLGQWADAMRVPAEERARWLRAGWLHDALRDAPLGDPIAHGPAAAERAGAAGERDRGVLEAVRYHTTGSPNWDDVGKMLYLADFLEPGRARLANSLDRAELEHRVPAERDTVLREVARRRLEWILRSGWPLAPETVAFWNQLARRPDGHGRTAMRVLMWFAVLVFSAGCGGDTDARPIPGDRGSAITVEVLNASGRAGDARIGTRLLRRAGIDVVYFGNAGENGLDSTRIIVRRGSEKVGQRVRAALGQGRVEIELDSSKLLDVSVLLGSDFSPPAGSRLDFHP